MLCSYTLFIIYVDIYVHTGHICLIFNRFQISAEISVKAAATSSLNTYLIILLFGCIALALVPFPIVSFR